MANETEFVEVSGYSKADLDKAKAQGATEAISTHINGTNTIPSQVLSGQVFASAPLENNTYKKTGTMPNKSTKTYSFACDKVDKTYSLEEGYHTTNSKVMIPAIVCTETASVSSRVTSQNNLGDHNKVKFVDTTGVPNVNNNANTYSFAAPTDGTPNANIFTLAENHNYKKFSTLNAYNKGYANGHGDWQNAVSVTDVHDFSWYDQDANYSVACFIPVSKTGIICITVEATRYTSTSGSTPDINSFSAVNATQLSKTSSSVQHKPSSAAERAYTNSILYIGKVTAGSQVQLSFTVATKSSGNIKARLIAI